MITKENKSDLSCYGVYKILNLITKEFYIGSTVQNFKFRFYKHSSDRKLKKSVKLLYNAFDEYGFENFEFIIISKFKTRKNPKQVLKVIRELEERYIKNLNPKYNICKHPSKGGCPNLGRKLSDEWKNKIREKSKLYKHSDNEIVFEKVKTKNKKDSSSYEVCDQNKCFTGSLIECSEFFKVDKCTILNHFYGKYNSKFLKSVKKLKSQKKKIKLFLENEIIIFNSFSECDKHLNMWRGYTSTQVTKKNPVLISYKYEILD